MVLDAGTTGDEGRFIFENIMKEAERQALRCAGILILSEEQAGWAKEIPARSSVAVLVRPVTLKQVRHKLQHLVPLPSKGSKTPVKKRS